MATMKEIAKKVGVSTAAVSYAINNKPGVNEETKQKILDAVNELGYTPNSIARSLKTKRTDIIGIVVPNISSIYTSKFLEYLEHAAKQSGMYVLIGCTDGKIANEKKVIKSFIEKNIDGIILCPGNGYKEASYQFFKQEALESSVPFVVFGLNIGNDISSVSVDLKKAQYQLTKSVLKKQITDIVFFGGDKKYCYSQFKFLGYQQAMEQAGLSAQFYKSGNLYIFEEGYHAALEYLRTHKKPQCIMAVNDIVACGALKALRELQLSDIMVTGFDGIKVEGLTDDAMPTVVVPLEEMAQKVIDILNSRQLKICEVSPKIRCS